MKTDKYGNVSISKGTLDKWIWMVDRIIELSHRPAPFTFQEPYRSIWCQASYLRDEINRFLPEDE